MPNTLTQDIIEHVRKNPGAKRSQIIEGIGYQGSPMTISNTLVRLQHQRVLMHRGGPPKTRQWDVIDTKPIPVFLELAENILAELRVMHPSVRAARLAQRLEDLMGEGIEKDLSIGA